ncbi:hypothetical protein G4B88_027509 [Cannabis sativa]|uniref:Uncharacterized protein n=1 Tax=Cannabis sativa TaxID=3483 RepID=A0A7J6E0Z2_CANSA|nr:hypothetical protein G4B88_027509 [Cannabis sativa]
MVEEKKEEEEIIDYWWNIVVELVIKIETSAIQRTKQVSLCEEGLYTSKSLLMASAFGDLRGTFFGVPNDENDE